MSSETDMEVESPHVENTHTELLWVLWVMYFLDVTFWIHFHLTEGQFRWLERYTKTDIELGIPFHNVQHAFTRFFLLIKITTDEMWFWISWNYCDFLTRLCQKRFTCTRVKFVNTKQDVHGFHGNFWNLSRSGFLRLYFSINTSFQPFKFKLHVI